MAKVVVTEVDRHEVKSTRHYEDAAFEIKYCGTLCIFKTVCEEMDPGISYYFIAAYPRGTWLHAKLEA